MVNNCRIITLSNGRIVIPVSTADAVFENGAYRFDGPWRSFFVISDDGGETFRENARELAVPGDDKAGLQEPGAIELPDGRLYGYFRTGAGAQYESFSSDGGISWTQPRPSRFESPLSPMLIAKNPYNGRYYAVWNPFREDREPPLPRYPNTWGRTPLVFSESENGLDFCEPVCIEDDLRRGYCYPSLFFLSERTALVSYCSGGGEIAPLQKTTVSKIAF